MSIYLGNQQVAVIMPNNTTPIGIDEICNHTFISGDIVYNGERIWAYTFARTPITSFSGPNVKRFNNVISSTTDGSGGAVFMGCSNLTSINLPEILNLGTSGGYQFYQCTSLTTVNMPKLTSFGNSGYQFSGCTSLVTINLPALTNLGTGGYQFQGCTALKNVNLPLATGDPGAQTFAGCTGLEHIFLPKFSFGNRQYCFKGCTNLLTAVLPGIGISANYTNGYGFQNCSKLTAVDLGKVSSIKANDFQNCAALNTLVLRYTSMVTLANTNAFSGTRFASGKAGGILYVPSSLVATYQANSTWATILGYSNGTQNSIQAIEGSIYETKYVDGTTIS